MFYIFIRTNLRQPINFLSFFSSLKKTYDFQNTRLILTSNKEPKFPLYFKINNYSIVNPLSLYLQKIQLTKMDDVTELADLAEEHEVCTTQNLSVMDIDDDVSESEDESPELELKPSISIEKVPYKDNQYQYSFHINRNYYKSIVGKNGLILKRLCGETKTIIRVSKKKKQVVIIGSLQKRIIHAKHRIDELIESSKKKSTYTHFLSIPTNTNEIKNNFTKFKENVLKNCDVETIGFDEGMFQKPEKLHLTICMLHLPEESDQQKAIEAMYNCKKQIIDPLLSESGPLEIEFQGLKCMGSNPTKAKILYINVHEKTGFFQKISDAIMVYFIEQGLSRKEHDKVTLHMTVVNTFYLKKKKQKKLKKTFDATNILKEHENTYFGQMNLSTFHLSKLTAKSADGYFQATAKIEF